MGGRWLRSKLKVPRLGQSVFMEVADEASVAFDQLVWPRRDK